MKSINELADDKASIRLAAWLLSGLVGRETSCNLAAIAHLSSENSTAADILRQITRELLKVEPKNYLRVRDYFFELNDNIERRQIATPREYAKQLRSGEGGSEK